MPLPERGVCCVWSRPGGGEGSVLVYELNGGSEVTARKRKALLPSPHLAVWVEDLALSFARLRKVIGIKIKAAWAALGALFAVRNRPPLLNGVGG